MKYKHLTKLLLIFTNLYNRKTLRFKLKLVNISFYMFIVQQPFFVFFDSGGDLLNGRYLHL